MKAFEFFFVAHSEQKKMDPETAASNIIIGHEVADLARCFDVLLQNNCGDTTVLDKIFPFLGKDLLERNIIDYSRDPGVDITDSYFVLYEPFLRAKAALLVGTIIENCKEVPDVTKFVNPLIDLFTGEEEIEQCFALIGLTSISQRKPELILPHFPKLARPLILIIGAASSPAQSFSLYQSNVFKSQVFESFLDFMEIPGLLDTPENVQRLFESNITLAIIQIALSEYVYIPKTPRTLWKMIWLFLRITTEHPQGIKMWDLDHIPKNGPQACNLMRIALTSPEKAALVRNEVNKISSNNPSFETFTKLVKQLSQ